jgi:NAD(P)-dependent dehydrogenase (short-subunit alcohol dehydrogenase family)
MYQDLLKDRVAIITGAASGIGRASAWKFAEHGARVLLADIDEARGREAAEELRSRGKEALFAATDVSRADSAKAMVDAALARWGTVDILYNNAATTVLCNEQDRPVHELEEWIWDRMLAVCLKGVYLCSKHVLPVMMQKRKGVVINTASVDALIAEPGFDSYTAAKGGVISLTRSMAAEYAPYGIRVNAISPGYVITECQKGWYEGNARARSVAESLHLTRLGKPEDVASMALYLASDLAEFITGALIPVDGGFTAFKGQVPDVRTGH